MDILYLLIPMSAVLVLLILGVFAWANHTGQFEDIESEGRRILAPEGGGVDIGQAVAAVGEKQSADRSNDSNLS